ncbi:MAG: hypothetical protein J6K17_09425 [Oscillospiraceae bacterium]|nr:hypothetical protein [Oscillospiraceae bacterium]
MDNKSDIILKVIAVVAGAAALAICNSLEEKANSEVLKICTSKDSDT